MSRSLTKLLSQSTTIPITLAQEMGNQRIHPLLSYRLFQADAQELEPDEHLGTSLTPEGPPPGRSAVG
jgi:hypothetical protein